LIFLCVFSQFIVDQWGLDSSKLINRCFHVVPSGCSTNEESTGNASIDDSMIGTYLFLGGGLIGGVLANHVHMNSWISCSTSRLKLNRALGPSYCGVFIFFMPRANHDVTVLRIDVVFTIGFLCNIIFAPGKTFNACCSSHFFLANVIIALL